MKKNLFIYLLFVTLNAAHAQTCTPDLSITQSGMYPDTYTNLPYAYIGVPYSASVQFKVFTDTTISGTYVTITNITLDSVSALPAGFSYSSNPTNHVFPGGSNACASLYGIPQAGQQGIYHLVVHVTVHGIAFGFIPVTQAQTITGYRININAEPVAYFSGTPTVICEGDAVVFDDNSSNHPTAWSWSFPGGNPSFSNAQTPPPVVYATSGTKNITLTVSSPAGTHTRTKNAYITVNSGSITAAVSPDGNVSICSGDNIILSANSGSGLLYQWINNGIDISGSTSSTYVATASGNYSVRISNSGGCSNTSAATTVDVLSISSSVTASGPTSFCAGENVLLTANSGSGFNYQWKKNGVDVSGETNISYIAASSGVYSVVVTNALGCSSTSSGTSVIVNTNPSAVIAANGPITFCRGNSVTLSANTGTGLNYQWSSVHIPVPGATNSNYIASAKGWYRVTVANSFGCSTESNMIHVYVNDIPSPVLNANGPIVFCNGNNVTLTSTNIGSGTTYQWTKHNINIPGQTGSSYYATKSGTYRVIVTNSFGCTRSSFQTIVTVNNLPAAVITTNGPLIFCQGQSVNLTASTGIGYSYQWTKHDVNIPGQTGSSYLAKKTGNYKVRVTDLNGCTKVSAPKNVLVNCRDEAASVLSDDENNTIVFPNPASSNATIDLNLANEEMVSIKTFDMEGKLIDIVASGIFAKGHYEFNYDVSFLEKGIYLVKIERGNVLQTIKLSITNN